MAVLYFSTGIVPFVELTRESIHAHGKKSTWGMTTRTGAELEGVCMVRNDGVGRSRRDVWRAGPQVLPVWSFGSGWLGVPGCSVGRGEGVESASVLSSKVGPAQPTGRHSPWSQRESVRYHVPETVEFRRPVASGTESNFDLHSDCFAQTE